MRNLIILSDYGLDDAVASAYIFRHSEEFAQIDIVAVAGNVTAERSRDNALTLLGNLDADLTNVRVVDTCKVEQHFSHLPSIHGRDGMGDLLTRKTIDVKPVNYADYVNDLPKTATVLSLGPLTVTVDLLKRMQNPELIIMAGMVDATPNYNGYEFNHYLDKAAFTKAVQYPHAIATLDTCRASVFNMIDRTGEESGTFGALIDRAIELARARHPDNCYIYDYVAAQYLLHPERFTVETKVDPWGNVLQQLAVKPV